MKGIINVINVMKFEKSGPLPLTVSIINAIAMKLTRA